MLSSARSLFRASKTAELPRVASLRDLYKSGVTPRAGQLVMIFGQTGSGKSTFILHYLNEMNVPSILYSADTDAQDSISRLGAMRTGWTVDQVSDAISNGAADYISDQVYDSKIQWCWDSSPTLQDIVDELDAYVELNDAYPRVIVVDNLMNVEAETDDEQGGLRLVLKELHRLAHETGITVFLLHHAREEGDPLLPSGRDKLKGKASELPEVILSVSLDQVRQLFHIAAVKVRSGKSDPTGNTYVSLKADPARAMFSAYDPPQYSVSYQGRTESW